jgi:flagellar biosynthesis protein FlhF
MVEAMALVREELGAEALILGSRRIAGEVEITVAMEPPDQPPPPALVPAGPPETSPAPSLEWESSAEAQESTTPGSETDASTANAADAAPSAVTIAGMHAFADIVIGIVRNTDPDIGAKGATGISIDRERGALLKFHAVPAELHGPLMSGPLDAALAATLPFGALALAPGERPILIVGPPGAGKTLTAARLATRLLMAGVTPTVITADGRRAGATEQLAAFTRLLGVNLTVASHPVTLGRALARRQAGAPVLIDSPGTDPFDPAQIAEMRALAAAAGATIALVLPAGLDPAEAADLAFAYAETGATLLIGTRLDIARRLGGLLAAAAAARLPLAEAGIGPGAADGLIPLTPSELATRLMQMPTRTGLSDYGRHAA